MSIVIPKKEKTFSIQIEFLKRILKKNGVNEQLNGIHYDFDYERKWTESEALDAGNNSLVGTTKEDAFSRLAVTDGKRLHYTNLFANRNMPDQISEMKKGTYRIVADTPKEIVLDKMDTNYPNYKGVLLETSEVKFHKELYIKENLFEDGVLLSLLYALPEKSYYNLNFFKDLVMKKEQLIWTFYWWDKDNAVLLQNAEHGLHSLFMPLYIKD
jgi:hypothetical protein